MQEYPLEPHRVGLGKEELPCKWDKLTLINSNKISPMYRYVRFPFGAPVGGVREGGNPMRKGQVNSDKLSPMHR